MTLGKNDNLRLEPCQQVGGDRLKIWTWLVSRLIKVPIFIGAIIVTLIIAVLTYNYFYTQNNTVKRVGNGNNDLFTVSNTPTENINVVVSSDKNSKYPDGTIGVSDTASQKFNLVGSGGENKASGVSTGVSGTSTPVMGNSGSLTFYLGGCTYTSIPYKTTYVYDDTMYEGERWTTPGMAGQKQSCGASNIYGEIIPAYEKVLYAPKDEVVEVGTKQRYTGPTEAEIEAQREANLRNCLALAALNNAGSSSFVEECHILYGY